METMKHTETIERTWENQIRLTIKMLWLIFILLGLFNQAFSANVTDLAVSSNSAGDVMTITWTSTANPDKGTLIVYSLDVDFGGWTPTMDYSSNSIDAELDGSTGVYFVCDIASSRAAQSFPHTTAPNTSFWYAAYSYTNKYAAYSSGTFTAEEQSLPVELGLWEAASDKGAVKLTWITESEIENQGFIIERKAAADNSFQEMASFISHDALQGQGSTTRQTTYEFIDKDVAVGETYAYRLADVDYISTITYHDIISVTVRASVDTQQPESIVLQQAYPNPFNPVVSLGFSLEKAADIELSIYDLCGRLVKSITRGNYPSGSYSYKWDGRNGQGEVQSAGVYIIRLSNAYTNQIQRITFLR